jgi:hypothetical protein
MHYQCLSVYFNAILESCMGFFLLHSAQTGSGSHTAYPMDTGGGSFPEGKAAGT